MKITRSDRRLSRRYGLKIPLRVRIWKSAAPERPAQSLNLSQTGVYFATNSPIREGETVEILLSMPEAITDEPEAEWRCTGHVVRVDRVDSSHGNAGIGVQFDCYEVSRTPAPRGAPANQELEAGHATERGLPLEKIP
ncbi:MAG TPA: PilZ domain-containing protein [Candidatus Acidoferrum sp.]|nr:PilZ domain-containing protein [Candidatus Acidoferrum sp.]